MASKRKEPAHATKALAPDAAEADGTYLVAIPDDLFLRLGALAARHGVTTEDFVVATLEHIALPYSLPTTAPSSQFPIYDD